jgi:hypothetical protein
VNPWVLIVAQYGLPVALELAKMLSVKADPKPEDWQTLIDKYGTETIAEKLARAQARLDAIK